ncbi:MAG: SDR family NAD(P)-dependent oxidoreductase [Pseudomonadota bacterium]
MNGEIQPGDILIDLTGFSENNPPEKILAILKQSFLNVSNLAKHRKPSAYIVVQHTDGEFALKQANTDQAMLGGLAGLVKTAQKEWPDCKCKVIDVAHIKVSENLLDCIMQESLHDFSDIEVGYRDDGKRIVCRTEPIKLQLNQQQLNLTNSSVVLVSGGGRGVTAVCLEELAKHYPAHYVLFGRTPLIELDPVFTGLTDEKAIKAALIDQFKQTNQPLNLKEIDKIFKQIIATREIANTLAKLEKLGAKATYIVLDINDAKAVAEKLIEIKQRYGNIHGFIHGAGVLADKLIQEKTETQFSFVFNTKVIGFLNIYNSLDKNELKLLSVFSSVAARFGNIGQVDYAMANECLNKKLQAIARELGDKCMVKAIEWGPWEGGMVTPALKKVFLTQGIQLIPLQQGAQAFVEICQAANLNVEIVVGAELGNSKDKQSSQPNQAGQKKNNLIRQQVSLSTHPYLKDHRIKGNMVLPMCHVLYWLIEVYANSNVMVNNLMVNKGIIVAADKLEEFNLHLSEETDHLNIKIMDDNKRLYYSAELSKSDLTALEKIENNLNISRIFQAPVLQPGKIVYDNNYLFHGPSLQGIKEFAMIDTGILASLEFKNSIVLPSIGFFDCGLQLIRVWSCYKTGKKTLPMRVLQIMVDKNKLNSIKWCLVNITQANHYKVTADVYFLDDDKKLVSYWHKVEEFISMESG